jgi:hypothetical protein
MTPQESEDLIAELAALNALALTALKEVAMSKINPAAYLSRVLDSGIEEMGKTEFWSVPKERRAAVVENARGRFTDMISSIKL